MKLGFLFPGQGAQHLGMAEDVAAANDVVAERYAQAADALGFDLRRIVRDGPLDELNRTQITQPAMLVVSVALHDAWVSLGGPRPAMVAGHSLGEYSALTVAGALDFAAAVRLVYERGKQMQLATPPGEGAMTAIIGLDDDGVAECCAATDGVVTPANYNSPGQVVIAGAAAAVETAASACLDAGARRAVPLDVSVPSHCALMAPASERLAELLDEVKLRTPTVPVVQNADAGATTDPAAIRGNLLRQLVSPVRWSASMTTMASAGLDVFVECGAGNVLGGLARRINRKLAVHGIGTLDALQAALQQVGESA